MTLPPMRQSCAGRVAFINRHFRRGPTGRDTASSLTIKLGQSPNTNEVRAATVTSALRRVHDGRYWLPLLVAGVSRTSGALIPAGAKLKIQIEPRPDRLCIFAYLAYLGPHGSSLMMRCERHAAESGQRRHHRLAPLYNALLQEPPPRARRLERLVLRSFLGHVRRDPKPTGSESHGTAQIATSDGWRELKQDIVPV